MTVKFKILLATSLLSLIATSALAGGDSAAGEEKAVVCQSCHGPSGNQSITPDIPVLAGQYEDYLEHALKAYRSGDRQQAVMSTFAGQLSDQDIADIAAYFAEQSGDLKDLSIN